MSQDPNDETPLPGNPGQGLDPDATLAAETAAAFVVSGDMVEQVLTPVNGPHHIGEKS